MTKETGHSFLSLNKVYMSLSVGHKRLVRSQESSMVP
jgi:hypothetical protein